MVGALLVLALVGLIALSLWAIVDATLQPDQAYRAAGINKTVTTVVLIVTCAVGSAYYGLVLRPRLMRVRRAPGS